MIESGNQIGKNNTERTMRGICAYRGKSLYRAITLSPTHFPIFPTQINGPTRTYSTTVRIRSKTGNRFNSSV